LGPDRGKAEWSGSDGGHLLQVLQAPD